MGKRKSKRSTLVRIRIRRQDGVVQHIYLRGRKRARNHPLKLDRKGNFQNTGPFYAYRALPQRTAPSKRGGARAGPAPAPATEPTRTPAPATTPRVVAPARRTGAKYTTWFKAAGSTERDMGFGDSYKQGLMEEENEEFAAPKMFFSNQGALLGKVKFKGIVPLNDLIDSLNEKLQFLGEEVKDFDFRTYYTRWSYNYQVVESLGPTDRIIDESRDSRP